MKKTDEQLAQKAKEAFDQSVDGLDAATLSRLNRSRHAALAAVKSSPIPSGQSWLRWASATGVTAAVLLLLFSQQGPGNVEVITAPALDLEILLSEESIEMLEELEFYSWLDAGELEGDLG